MLKVNTKVQFFIHLARAQAILNRKFDNGLGGLGFNEFIILFHLSQGDGKMRRIDLAEKIGFTASGITRLLLPMEKIGLVKKEVDPRDARVSYVMLAPGGKRQFNEALERAELLSEDILPVVDSKQFEQVFQTVSKLV